MTIHRKVKRAVDGDTLELYRKFQGTRFVRIAGRDATERGERGYGAAKEGLNLLTGNTVTLIPLARSYSRLVAEVRYRRRKVR